MYQWASVWVGDEPRCQPSNIIDQADPHAGVHVLQACCKRWLPLPLKVEMAELVAKEGGYQRQLTEMDDQLALVAADNKALQVGAKGPLVPRMGMLLYFPVSNIQSWHSHTLLAEATRVERVKMH